MKRILQTFSYIPLLLAVLLIALPVMALAQGTNWDTPPAQAIPVEPLSAHLLVAEDGTCYAAGLNNVIRYRPDGTRDPDWGEGGTAVLPIRPALLYFDGNGDILAGSADQEGLYRLDAATGMGKLIIPEITVSGLAVDGQQQIYINSRGKLSKRSADLALVWERPLQNPEETGLCLLPDGSFITTVPETGTLCKYTPQGELDVTFGNGGLLRISDGTIGQAQQIQPRQGVYEDNRLYVACYQEGVIKSVSCDGQSAESVVSGAFDSLLAVTPQYYYLYIAEETGGHIRLIQRPLSHMQNHGLACAVTPTVLATGTTQPVLVEVTSASPHNLGVTAKLYATGMPGLPLTGTGRLKNGNANVSIPPPESGWVKGQYAVQLAFTDSIDGVTVTETLTLVTAITVKNIYTITFYAEGVDPMVRTVWEGESLTDIPPVPPREGYAGAWDVTDFHNISGDMVVNAIYTRITYTVTFKAQGHPDIIKIVEHGDTLTDIPPVPAKKGYAGAWDTTDFANITSDRVVHAVYTRITHTVTFRADDSPDIIRMIGDGDTLTDIPPVPAKQGYTGAWDTTDFTNITSDMLIHAVYTRITHTVTFRADDSPDIVKIVGDGDTLTDIPPVPAKKGYAGQWDATDFTNITADRVVRAIYTELTVPTLSQGDLTITGIEGTTFGYFTKLVYQPVTDEQRLTVAGDLIKKVAKDKKLVNVFEVQLLHYNRQIQPDGQIQLKIKLSEELQQYTNLQVVWLSEDQQPLVLDCTVEGAYLTFTTDRVGQWALIGDPPKKGISITIPTPLFVFLFLGAAVFSSKKIMQVY